MQMFSCVFCFLCLTSMKLLMWWCREHFSEQRARVCPDFGTQRWEGDVSVWVGVWSCSWYFFRAEGGGEARGWVRAGLLWWRFWLLSSDSLYPVALVLTFVYTHSHRLLLPPSVIVSKSCLCPSLGCVWLVTRSSPKSPVLHDKSVYDVSSEYFIAFCPFLYSHVMCFFFFFFFKLYIWPW